MYPLCPALETVNRWKPDNQMVEALWNFIELCNMENHLAAGFQVRGMFQMKLMLTAQDHTVFLIYEKTLYTW
jgi:hypothetical protein